MTQAKTLEAERQVQIRDFWGDLSAYTDARIALGRTGSSLLTHENLRFSLAHAAARDAVHTPFDLAMMEDRLAAAGFATLALESAAAARDVYLRRPDLGRRLSEASRQKLATEGGSSDVVVVIADGLSSTAVHENALPFLMALRQGLEARNLTLSQVVLVRNGRVAIGDEIGKALGGRLVLVAIGERPGLSAADSLGVYLTYGPEPGRTDSERNCISNIRAQGVLPEVGAATALWLVEQALQRGLTGIQLKDESHPMQVLPDAEDGAALPDMSRAAE